MSDSYSWAQMLSDFRSLGGVAENIEQRVGKYGNGIFPIDPAEPVRIGIPKQLLVDADHLILEEKNLVVSPAAGVDARVRAFHALYQRHFSWGADGRKSAEAFESDLKTLPIPLLERLRQLDLLNLEVRHQGPWSEVLRRCFLQSRKIIFQERKVSMPLIELINHCPQSPGYTMLNEGIGFTGTFPGEVTVNYSPTSDSLLRFLNYGFASQEPQAYSLGLNLELGGGRKLYVGFDPAGITNTDGLPVPTVENDGERRKLAHLKLGAERAPRMPRTLLRRALPDLAAADVDEIFDRIRNVNQIELINLLELADGVNTPICKMFRQAMLFQLRALTYCYGGRTDL